MVRQSCSYIKDWKHMCQLKYAYPSKCDNSLWDHKLTRRENEGNNRVPLSSVNDPNSLQDSQTAKTFSSRNTNSKSSEGETKESVFKNPIDNGKDKMKSYERRQENRRKNLPPNNNPVRKDGFFTNVDILTEETFTKDLKHSKLKNSNLSTLSPHVDMALQQIVLNKNRDYINSNCNSFNNNAVQIGESGSQSKYGRKRRPRFQQRQKSNEWMKYPTQKNDTSFHKVTGNKQDNFHGLQNAPWEIANYLKSNLNLKKIGRKGCGDLNYRSSANNNNNNNSGGEVALSANSSSQSIEECEVQMRRRVNVVPLDPLLRNCRQIIDRHPSIYVSQTGLVNLFLRGGTLLEVTVDKTLRLVDQRLNIAVALNWRDRSCNVYHPQAVITMTETSADIELYGKWQARMRSGNVLAADKCRSVWFDSIENYGTTKYDKHQFLNCVVDNTVDLVYSTSAYGPWVFKHSTEMVSTARFQHSHTGNMNVNLKDVRITQKYSGDLLITCGQNLIKMWPRFGSVEVQTASMYISIRPDQKIKGKQWNTFSFTCCPEKGMNISNRKMEVYLLQLGRIDFFKLPERVPLKQ